MPAKKRSKVDEEHQQRIIAEMQEASALLAEFGLSLHGYDPGVTAYFTPAATGLGSQPHLTRFSGVLGMPGQGAWGEPISFSRVEWRWLKPLLEELRERRKVAK